MMPNRIPKPTSFFVLKCALVFFGALRLALPVSKADELLAPALGQHAVYEVNARISEEPETSPLEAAQEGKAPGKTLAERSTNFSYILFPGRSESERRMLLLRSVAIRVNDLPLPATNEALVYSMGKDSEATLSADTPEEPRVSAYELHLPSALFPKFDLPGQLERATGSREEEVKILGGVAARLPVEVNVEKAGSTLKVVRRLKAGKTARVDFEGSSSTLEAWSETHVIDLERKVVAEVRREIKFLTERGQRKYRTIATHELKARKVRLLDPAERERAAAVLEGVASILDDFRAKKPPRDIYAKIQLLQDRSLKDGDSAKLFSGLSEALLFRFAMYRQGLEAEARGRKVGSAAKEEDAPDFTLEGLDGKSVSFRQATRGKVVLLTFWGYG